MDVIDASGNYAFVPGTRKVQQSSHPVYQARIEVALGIGTWLYAPDQGHNLARFKQMRATTAAVDEFQKELALYLTKYSPTLDSSILARGAVEFDLTIAEDALNV